MTIASQVSKAAYAGNGSTRDFPVPFRFADNADVEVTLRGAAGNEARLAETTHYTLTGAGTAEGGACLLAAAPAPGETLVLRRAPRIVQEVDYQENDAFPAETHEAALDLLTMICQALDERIGRAPLLQVSSGAPAVALADPAPGRALVWSPDGTALLPGPAAADITRAQDCAEQAAAARDQVLDLADGLLRPRAADLPYDPAASGLSAGNVQAALDELAARPSSPDAGLGNLLLAEALRRAIGDSANGREFLGDGWIDPLADADDLTLSGGLAFVSEDGGCIQTVSAGSDVAQAWPFTSDDCIHEDLKGSIAQFTVDAADTSGHFDAAAGARVLAGCRMRIGGTDYPIPAIVGDGTGANAVTFIGTLAAGTYAVQAIHGTRVGGGKASLAKAYGTPSYSHPLGSGNRTATIGISISGITIQSGALNGLINGVIAENGADAFWPNSGQAAAGAFIRFDFGVPVLVTEATWCQGYAESQGTWKWQGSQDGTSWTDLCTVNALGFDGTGGVAIQQVHSMASNTVPYRYLQLLGVGGNVTARYYEEVKFKVASVAVPAGQYYPLLLPALGSADWSALKALVASASVQTEAGTQDICAGGTASASAVYGSYAAANAFDNSTGTNWNASASAGWLAYDFGAPRRVWKYRVCPVDLDHAPKTWTFEGWNGSAWVVLDSQGNVTSWSAAAWKEFAVAAENRGAYSGYRLNVNANNNSGVNLYVAEMEMYEEVACGGIDYALSFDGGTTFSVWAGSAWRGVARDSAGTWQWFDGSTWRNASVNTVFGAAVQALAVEGNRMDGTALAALNQAAFESAGGFIQGRPAFQALVALKTTDTGRTPELDALTATVSTLTGDGEVLFAAYEAAAPEQAKVVLVLEAVDAVVLDEDLQAFVRRGSGDFVPVPLSVDSRYDASRLLVAGEADLSGGAGLETRLKLRMRNHKRQTISAASNSFRRLN